MNKQQKRVIKVLENMIQMVKENAHWAVEFSEMLEPTLDEVNMQDGFGTEGQCDPRGDYRNGEWSIMDKVEGIDK